MYVNEIVFYVWLVVTLSVLSGLVAWVIVKICKFVRDTKDTKFDVSRLKEQVYKLAEEHRSDFKYIRTRIENIEADKCKGEKDEIN